MNKSSYVFGQANDGMLCALLEKVLAALALVGAYKLDGLAIRTRSAV